MNDFTDGDKLIGNITHIAEKYQEILTQMLHQKTKNPLGKIFEAEELQAIATKAIDKMTAHPEKFISTNMEYVTKFTALLANTITRSTGEDTVSLYSPCTGDKRFKDPAWRENVYFDFIKQFYLMSSEWAQKQTSQLELEPRLQRNMEFYTKQFIDALCPTNFPFYNPEVLKESLSTRWENIAQGLDNLLEDLKASNGLLNIQTTDKMAFKLGVNIACTEGKVVMQTDMAQLIHYKPKKQVHAVPILIIPPWINKYYILDLGKENSLVKYLVDNNFQVFLLSWVNPGPALSYKNFEDYASEGIIAATKYIKTHCKTDKINAFGYCIGGTLLATALSYLKSKKQNYINSATYVTTLLDFTDPGEVGLFINEDTIAGIEEEMRRVGYFDGRYLAHSFSLLRANDLIWSFFVNNYLLGRRPLPFDLLYWNADSTNLPSKMHSFYLRNMYLENNLTKPDAITFLGEKVDLSKISTPGFFLGAKDDHIAPWRSVFNGMKLLGDNQTFCLSASGHVAGVVNPPKNKKYSYWHLESDADNADTWLSQSAEVMGSWWPYWLKWIAPYNGDLIEESFYKDANALEDAPGSYVRTSIT